MTWIALIDLAHATEGTLSLPSWPINNGWTALIGTCIIWAILHSSKWSAWLENLLRVSAITLTILSLGWFLGEANRQWLLLSIVVAVGWSMKELGADIFSSFLLRMEGNTKGFVSTEDFSGKIDNIGWRSVALTTVSGNPIIVPSRLLLRKAVQSLPPGQHPCTFHFWIPEGLTFEEASDVVTGCLEAIPWLAMPVAKIKVDEQSQSAMKVELRLMRIADKELVQKWIGNRLRSKAISA